MSANLARGPTVVQLKHRATDALRVLLKVLALATHTGTSLQL